MKHLTNILIRFLYLLTDKLHSTGLDNLAIQIVSLMILIDSNNPRYYYGKVNLLEILKRYYEAIDICTKAITLNYNEMEFPFYFIRGNCYYSIGKYDLAIQDYTEAINLTPERSLAYSGRANAYEKIESYNEAIKDYTKTIELDLISNQADEVTFSTYYARGRCKFNLGDIEGAKEDFAKTNYESDGWYENL